MHDWPGDCHLQSPPQWPTAHLDMLPLFGNIIEGSTAISLHPSSQRFDGGAAMPLLLGNIIEGSTAISCILAPNVSGAASLVWEYYRKGSVATLEVPNLLCGHRLAVQ